MLISTLKLGIKTFYIPVLFKMLFCYKYYFTTFASFLENKIVENSSCDLLLVIHFIFSSVSSNVY